MNPSTLRRALTGAAVAAVALVALPATAWAHVDAEGEAEAGGITQVTFSFSHGCGDAPTTSLRVQLPEGTTDVKAENPAGWTSTVTATELDWTGGSIPTGSPGEFVATMKLTGKAGDTVFFPTIQGCPGGASESWIDKTDDAEAENAAPRITLGAAGTTGTTEAAGDHDNEGGEGGTTTTAKATTTTTTTAKATTGTTAAGTTTTAKATTTEASSSSSTVPLIIAAVAILALVLGVWGYTTYRKGKTES